MKKIYKVAVIGGGASGLFSCVELFNESAFSDKDVILFERLDRVGKKILATGNGQCNVTNVNVSEKNYFGDGNFVRSFISGLKKIDLKQYFSDIGIPLKEEEDGKVYPLSKQANCVLDTLRFLLDEKVEFVYNSKITNIVKRDNLFEIDSNGRKYSAERVILAVGGKSAKQFGTDGTSYSLAESFGHKTTKLFPSLVQIKTNTDRIRSLRGIREEVLLKVVEKGKVIYETQGDLIFNQTGVSGNSVFKASSHIVGRENIGLIIDFLPDVSLEDAEKLIKNRVERVKNLPKEEILSAIVNKKIGQEIVKKARDCSPKTLAFEVKNFFLEVTGNTGFDYSQVTRGGIRTADIDETSFESKLSDNLYLIGEMLDIDGECGGYNLTFAVYSALACARDIKNKIKR